MKADDKLVLRTVVPLLFYLINVFSFYLLLRGHNLPGGGFIAGLGSALSVILLSLSMGIETAQRVLRVDPLRLAFVGLLISFTTALAPALFGQPFLSHYHVKLKNIPLVGEMPLGTPLLFDLGVFFVVIGVSTKLLFVLIRALSGFTSLAEDEHRRYAAPLERPIESAGSRHDEPPAAAHPGEDDL